MPGYQGWQWAVVVAAHPGADHATISEVVLVPGPTALLAPQWVPWHERVEARRSEPRRPARHAGRRPAAGARLRCPPATRRSTSVAAEVGLGRRQVLSQLGRADAAQRWHDGDFGPGSAMARSTRRVCRDCGFYLPLAGSLGTVFGVCANELSADGHVVDAEYGCGAHSDTRSPQVPARRCSTRSTTASSKSSSRRSPPDDEPPPSTDEPEASDADEPEPSDADEQPATRLAEAEQPGDDDEGDQPQA